MAMQKEGRSVRSPCFPVPGDPWRGRSEENPDFRSVQLVLRGCHSCQRDLVKLCGG